MVRASARLFAVFDPGRLRSATLARLAELGFLDPPPHLPVLFDRNEGCSLRSINDIINRTAALNVAVSVSYGMSPALARRWIADNALDGTLTPMESAVIDGDDGGAVAAMQTQVEAIWAFVWTLSLGERLDPEALCPDDLVRRVPDLKADESLVAWRERTQPRLRSASAVMAELDLYYCMTWGLADANLRGERAPGAIDQHAIWQRRRALEYTITQSGWTQHDWDTIDLST